MYDMNKKQTSIDDFDDEKLPQTKRSSVTDASVRPILRTAERYLAQRTKAKEATSDNISKALMYVGPGKPIVVNVDMERAYELSYLASRQVEEIAMTPYMRNALIHFGDIKEGERLKVDSPVTKAELYIQQRTKAKLQELYGKPIDHYDRSLSVLDERHYAVDNWRNFKTGTAMRDIQLGQQTQREEGFSTFREPAPQTPDLYNDKYIRVALRTVVEEMPHNIHVSKEFRDWSGPFENKHTQTSWPFFYRDDVVVSAENDKEGVLRQYYGKTYGQMCVEIARNTPIADTVSMAVNMGYGRNQRGKGRPLIAMSRIPAVIFNRMTQPETEACKTRCPFFIGYNDRQTLRNAMIRQATWAVENECAMENFDYHAFDQSISPEWLALAGAVWSTLAADNSDAQRIIEARTLLTMSGYLVDGIAEESNLKLAPVWGRQFSGIIETNKSENVINATASTAAVLEQDKQWIEQVGRRSPYPRMYMGDDCLITTRRGHFDHDRYVKQIAKYGFEVHPDKGEFGAFFLQNRLFESSDGFTFTYPWTRVLRSCFFKEKSRGLGPAGWTLATYSQLANILEYKEGLAFVRDLICEFDEQKLMLDKPVGEIISMVQEEDAQALSSNKRAMTTYEVVNDGDPGKVQLSAKESRYLTELQKAIREA